MVLTELAPYLEVTLSQWEIYGLFFLLGSFAVASLSDVRHLSAQREFLEVWSAFAITIFALGLYGVYFARSLPAEVLLAKWVLIGALCLLCWERIGILFSLARADVAALGAAASLLSPVLVLAFFGLAKLLSVPLAPLFRKGDAYPFLPVVTVATLALMALSQYVVPMVLRTAA